MEEVTKEWQLFRLEGGHKGGGNAFRVEKSAIM